MPFFRSLVEHREFSLARFDAWLDSLSHATNGSVEVTEQSALTWAAVWGCVLVKAQDMAKTPLTTFLRLGPNGRDGRLEAIDFPTWQLFRVAANPYTTAYQLRQTMQKDLEINGNAYALVERNRFGEIVALWHRRPQTMSVIVTDGRLRYRYDDGSGSPVYYEAEQVFHVKGLSHDGLVGISPVQAFRDGISLALQQQKHGVKTMETGVRAPFAIKTPPDVGPEKAIQLSTEFTKAFGGQINAGKHPFFFGGMEPVTLGFSNADAEFLESRRFSVEDACRIWRVPPPKLMDFLRATFSTVTEVNESYVNDSLRPGQENWEQEIHLKLMTAQERLIYYVEFDNFDALKGTPKERSEVEVAYVKAGISNVNEIRRSHNWNPVPGGDKNRTQMQDVPLDSADAAAAQQPPQKKRGAEQA